ncbi:MAG: hypothetical protein AAGH78_09740, partial [Cyanobacteria bacterium P01_H01_bin.58]
MPSFDPMNFPNNHPPVKPRRMRAYALLTLLGTGTLMVLNQTTPTPTPLPEWLLANPAAIAQQVGQSTT